MKRKTILPILAFVTSVSLTACSFQLKPPDKNATFQDYSSFTEAVTEAVEDTDFSNESEVSEMVDSIYDVSEETNTEFEQASLVRVVDGDTIVVDLDGTDYKVRLIGVNTPESVAPEDYRTENTAEGKDASEYVKEYLADTSNVYLETDISNTDKYGRLLRYVWLEIPSDKNDLTEISTKMLNGVLVDKGIAEVATYDPDVEYEWTFEELEER